MNTEEVIRAEITSLRARLEVAENILLEIEAKKPILNVEERVRIIQARCKHRKGGKIAGITKDFAIRDFTFIDGRREVVCLICGKKWLPGYRDWYKALEMLESTTNSASSSERIFTITPNADVNHRPHSKEEIDEAYAQERVDDESIIKGRVKQEPESEGKQSDIIIL